VIVGLLLGATAPARGQASLEEPALPEPHVVHQERKGLLVAGGVTFGVSYGLAVLLGLFTTGGGGGLERDNETVRDGRFPVIIVPVAGPMLEWWRAPASSRGSPMVWAAWSATQAAGAAMLVAGFVGHDVVEWRPVPEGPRVRVVPAVTPQSGALSLDVSW